MSEYILPCCTLSWFVGLVISFALASSATVPDGPLTAVPLFGAPALGAMLGWAIYEDGGMNIMWAAICMGIVGFTVITAIKVVLGHRERVRKMELDREWAKDATR